MKIAIHGQNLFGLYLAKSLRAAGHKVVDGGGSNVVCDIALIAGARNIGLIDFYRGSNTPVFIYEQGYMKRTSCPADRETGYWQLSKDKLNGIPDFDCPLDRFKKLCLDVKQSGGDPSGYVLVLGQKPGDAALNSTDHVQWLREKFERYNDVRYRPHPKCGWHFENEEVQTLDGTLEQAINGAKLVVCYNSTAGFEALIAGVPIECDPCAPYYGKSESISDRLDVLSRAAYGQWTISESDEAVDFMLKWAQI
jgi:hypothetical protein